VPDGASQSGTPTAPLSEKLDRSSGVIRPPSGVDPGISHSPPAIGSHSMPVIQPNPTVAPAAADPLQQARDAIAQGAPREQVIERLKKMGVDTTGL
jgi:hypothetical protein